MALKVAQVPCTAYWLYSLPEIYYLLIIHNTFWYAGWVRVGPDNPFNPPNGNKQPLNTSLCFLGRAGRSAHPWNALALFPNYAHFPQKKNRTFLVSRHCPLRLCFFLWVFHAPDFFAYAVFCVFIVLAVIRIRLNYYTQKDKGQKIRRSCVMNFFKNTSCYLPGEIWWIPNIFPCVTRHYFLLLEFPTPRLA